MILISNLRILFNLIFASNHRLNPEQEKKIIKLLAIAQENKRGNRVRGDTLFEMIRQIQNDERQVQTDSIYQSKLADE